MIIDKSTLIVQQISAPMSKPSDPSRSLQKLPLHRRFGYRLNMIAAAIGQHTLLRVQRQFGLNLAEYRVMNALAAFASPSIKDIAKNSQLDKAHVTRALAGLIKRGLVTQIVDKRDRRLRVVKLTAAGREIAAAFGPFQLERQKRLERRLTASELRVFWQAMSVLSEETEQMLADEVRMWHGRRRSASAPVNATARGPRKTTR
jgi:DNA-binding MarR family transcriptional regulator